MLPTKIRLTSPEFSPSQPICLIDRSDPWKELVYVGHLKQLKHARTHSNQNEPNSSALAPNIVADDQPEPRRIHIRDLRQIQNMARRNFESMRTALLLRFKRTAKHMRRKGSVHVPRGKRPRQSKNDCARSLTLTPINREPQALPDLSCRHRASHSHSTYISQNGSPENKPGIRVTYFNTQDMAAVRPHSPHITPQIHHQNTMLCRPFFPKTHQKAQKTFPKKSSEKRTFKRRFGQHIGT